MTLQSVDQIGDFLRSHTNNGLTGLIHERVMLMNVGFSSQVRVILQVPDSCSACLPVDLSACLVGGGVRCMSAEGSPVIAFVSDRDKQILGCLLASDTSVGYLTSYRNTSANV